MSWNQDFVSHISADRITPVYLVESVSSFAGARPITQTLRLTSSRAIGGAWKTVIAPEGSRITYGSLRLGEWSYTLGEWEIGLVDQNDAATDVRGYTTRGQLVELKIGFPGWTVGQFQSVALGVVQGIGMSGGRWVLRVRSILSALTCRSDIDLDTQALFHELVETTVATGGYTPGGNLELDDPDGDVYAALERESAGANKFAVRVTDDDGNQFVYLASAKTNANPVVLTYSSVILGTDAAAGTGNRAEVLAHVQAHPLEAIRKVLCSTGDPGANGAFDTLPESWGLAIDQELVDDADCANFVAAHTPVGVSPANWDVYAAASVDDPLSWIASVLAPMGGFVCERMGKLTIRAVNTNFQRPYSVDVDDVYEDDIVSIDSYDSHDPDQPVEYGRAKWVDAHADSTTTGSTETISTLPSLTSKRIDLPFLESNRTDWRELIRDANGPYYTRIGEPVALTLRGWRLAQLAPGSHLRIHVDSKYLTGRRRGTGGDLSDGAAITVTSVQPNWFGATVRILGTLIPNVGDEGG